MNGFIGRRRELRLLTQELRQVGTGDRHGRCVLLRGRRRVGKSRLVEEFCENSGWPFLFFSALGGPPSQDLARFAAELHQSNLPNASLSAGVIPQNWEAALRLLSTVLPDDSPSIVVIDELPYLAAADQNFESVLQHSWDRHLSKKPVLLLLVGSDLAMMEMLNSHDHPFHQRGKPMRLDPLTPAEVGAMLQLDSAAAFDAYLVTGGLPMICREWPAGLATTEYLAGVVANPTSAQVVSAQLTLAAEFPATTQPRQVLAAIGSGECSFNTIQRAMGTIAATSLHRSLQTLTEKRIVAAELPLSTMKSSQTRYRITDPYLRFWLYFLEKQLPQLDRGRGDLVLAHIRKGWTSWRGRAVERIAREALARMLPNDQTSWLAADAATTIGAYWTRNNDVEVDIVAADQGPIARTIGFVGSIKWHEKTGFDDRDAEVLRRMRDRVPGTEIDTPLVAVSRLAATTTNVNASFSADELIQAWPLD